jgi:hypothetical protein
MKSINTFVNVVAVALGVPAVLGATIGLAYSYGLIGSNGWWVSILNWFSSVLLDKTGLVLEIIGGIYLAGWSFLGGLAKVYQVGKWLLIKCFIGLGAVPMFVLTASYWISDLRAGIPGSILLTTEGILLGWVWYKFLPLPPSRDVRLAGTTKRNQNSTRMPAGSPSRESQL